MGNPTLLPCPHCGSPAVTEEIHSTLPNGTKDTLFRVRCTLRECLATTTDWCPEEAAIKAWDRRVGEDHLRSVIRDCARTLQWNLGSSNQKDEQMMMKSLELAWNAVGRDFCESD